MIDFGSIQYVFSSISANTGRAPVRTTQFADEESVKRGTITSSPIPMPITRHASSSPCVHDGTANTYEECVNRFITSSNLFVYKPSPTPLLFFNESATIRDSSFPQYGLWSDIFILFIDI